MFYSHQLLARKAPLGQIWMAATMHAKINRRKLDKINLVKICEEILNPTVPMALRLSGILLGGVVIVYERKVKLLYDDLTRLVVEINEAWKMKPEADPTILPKSKLRAKYEAVTLEEKPLDDEMMAELEQQESLRYAAASAATFQQSTFLHMGLDSVGDAYININPGEEDIDLQHHHHQADIENITLFEDINPRLQETSLFNRAERFDNIIEGSGHITFSQSYPEVPMTLMPSPPEAPEDVVNMKQEEKPSSNDCKSKSEKTKQDGQKRQHTRRKARGKSDAVVMDIEQTIIPGQMYQTWIRDASDIVSRRGRKRKSLHPFFSAKISDLMELPPVALISGFQNDITGEIHYPAALLDLWKKFTHQPRKQDSRPGTIHGSQKQQPYSATERQKPWEPRDFLFEDFQNVPDIEKLMQLSSDKKQQDNPMEFDFMTVGSSGHSAAESIRSASSGRGSIQIEKEFQLSSDRSKKRQSPSSRQSFGSLDPVLEENSMREYRTDFKLRRVSEGPTPEFELMEETGPTQTMKPQNTELALNEITRTIQTQLKTHFDAPGAPRAESLNQLALGMNRRKAAQLFYHTCVLATTDFLRVEQSKPYGEIYISRGSKM